MSESLEYASGNPPVEGGLLGAEEPLTKWPKVIGIIGIVLASLGLVCGCAGYFAVPLQRWGMQMQAQSGQSNPVAEAQVKIAGQFMVVTNVLLTLGMVLTIWLLVSSISLLRRRRKSRVMLIAWAMLSILSLAINIALQILMFQATFAELARLGESQRAAELWIGVAIGGFFAIVFGLALQVFVLIWFSRKKIVAEVSQWP